MQTKTTIQFISAVLVSTMLTACGGAGSASSISGGGGGGIGGTRIGLGSGATFVPSKMKIDANASALFNGQTTNITVNVVDADNAFVTTSVIVVFSSPCIRSGTSSITGGGSVVAIDGVATAEYKAGTCFGDDTITAKISNSAGGTATGVISAINNKRIGLSSGTFTPGQLEITKTSSSASTSLFEGDTAQISAYIVDNKGNLVTQDTKVTFTSDCLTNQTSSIAGGSNEAISSNGKASITYTVGKCSANDTITATTQNGSTTISATGVVPIDSRHLGSGVGTAFEEGKIDVGIGSSILSPGGSTNLTTYFVNSKGEPATDSIPITFSSPCIASGNATITVNGAAVTNNTVTITTGKSVVTYTSTGCAGIGGVDDVKAVATFQSNTLTATASIAVKTDTAQTITFIDAKPALISLKGTGGLETSIVRFQVTGQAGTPVKGVCVTFAPSTTVGGLALVPSNCNPAGPETYGATSDANGYVSTTVQAGSVATSVSIIAKTPNGISTQSNALAVTTGIPDQNSMSISLTDREPNSWRYDGIQSTVNIRMADAFNNPVPDNTTVTFTTSGGSIVGSCPTKNGACSAVWTSQEPRPHLKGSASWSFDSSLTLSCSNGAKECRDGRVKILATAIGNESFIDGNGNGLYDDIDSDIFVNSNGIYNTATKGTTVTNTSPCSPAYPASYASQVNNVAKSCDDLREAYIDKNFSGDKDATEEVLDFNQNGMFDPLPNGKYDGALCSGAAKANGDCTTNSVNVRADTTLVMSDETPYILGSLVYTPPPQVPVLADLRAGRPVLPKLNGNSYSTWDGRISVALDKMVSVSLLLADKNGNGMPAGTSINIDSTNLQAATATIGPTPLAMSQEPIELTLSVTGDKTNPAKGSLDINITAGGITSTVTVYVNY